MNQFLDPTNKKFIKLAFFMDCFFQNMITLKGSVQTVSVSLSVWSSMNVIEQRSSKVHRKTPVLESHFNEPTTLLKMRFWYRFFPVNFDKSSGTTIR